MLLTKSVTTFKQLFLRFFSASAQVLTARRCRMQDKTLDMHIFLRSLKTFLIT